MNVQFSSAQALPGFGGGIPRACDVAESEETHDRGRRGREAFGEEPGHSCKQAERGKKREALPLVGIRIDADWPAATVACAAYGGMFSRVVP